MVYVIRQRRITKDHSINWSPVSLIDAAGYFHGAAVFDNEQDANAYVKTYVDMVTKSRKDKNRDIKLKVKIFAEEKRPAIGLPVKKKSYTDIQAEYQEQKKINSQIELELSS